MKEGYGFKVGQVVENSNRQNYYNSKNVGRIIDIEEYVHPEIYNNVRVVLACGNITYWHYGYIHLSSSLMQELF
jgi:hypothetical protein